MSVLITTVDNPYDPVTDFKNWYVYDLAILKHNTLGKLCDIAIVNDSMTDEEYSSEIERAIDELIAIDPFVQYKKIVTDDPVRFAGPETIDLNVSDEDVKHFSSRR